MTMDPELSAMQEIAEAVNRSRHTTEAREAAREAVANLDDRARLRVIHWVAEKYPYLRIEEAELEAEINRPQTGAEIAEPEIEL